MAKTRRPWKTLLDVVLLASGFIWASVAAPNQSTGPSPVAPWCGGVTTSAATVKVRLGAAGASARLAVSERPDLDAAIFSSAVASAATSGNVVALTVTNLQPATTYYYGLEVNGSLDSNPAHIGRFTTLPTGAASFRFAFGGDSDYRRRKFSQKVFETIAAEEPLFFIFIGDLHYNDTNVPSVAPYRANYDAVLAGQSFGKLLRSMNVVYVWDDHDCAGNGTDKTRIGIPFARRAFREYVPSYPLATSNGTINQAFTVGRARFIITDNRSASDPATKPDDANKTMLGAAQKAWFKNQLLAAKASPNCKVIFWVSSNPWIGSPRPNKDRWQSYTTERREIADFLKANAIRNLCILSADMHALAYDDGSNSDYATGGGLPIPVLQAAPLAQVGSRKGGPYSSGRPIMKAGQYGIVEISDDGASPLSVTFFGKRFDREPPTLLTYRFNVQ